VPLVATAMFLILARRTRIEETYLIARFGDSRASLTLARRFQSVVWRRYIQVNGFIAEKA
jgi:hypothetical protein